MVPSYEVKLLLQPSIVLGSDNKLQSSVLSAFSIPASVKKMNVQFLDTDTKDLYKNGWILRIRKTEGEDELELTYKKRYAIDDGYCGKSEGDIDASLKMAENDGFNATAMYEAQIEMGYQKQTLSISHDRQHPSTGLSGIDLPLDAKSREILTTNAPEKLKDWLPENWAFEKLSTSKVYGPVLAKRSKGKWGDMKLFVEVWRVKNKDLTGFEHIVEASFKTENRATALQERNKLAALLKEKGWLLAEDSLKTALIMERY